MKASFSLEKMGDFDPKKYKISLRHYKTKVKEILEKIFEIKELNVFENDVKKLEFDICFCNNKEIREINAKYRNKNTPTDVITFSLFSDDEYASVVKGTAHLGQIIVSIERANEQKKDTLEKEILTLIIHGILHLFGFDHQTKEDYDFVVSIQNKILENL